MENKILIAGFPESGKSTFLAALFHYLDNDHDAQEDQYTTELPADITHINALRNAWARCERVERSNMQEHQEISFGIKKNGKRCFDICLPDISGELFDQVLSERGWDARYSPWVTETDTLLVFIHPTKKENPLRIDTIIDAAQGVQGTTTKVEPKPPPLAPFEYKNAPTAVKLVDLLQILIAQRNTPPKIGLIISAWDLISTQFREPREYLKQQLPLLHQYIETNSDTLNLLVAGVSAQGGDVDKDAATIRQMPSTSRVRVNISGQVTNDFNALIAWMNGE